MSQRICGCFFLACSVSSLANADLETQGIWVGPVGVQISAFADEGSNTTEGTLAIEALPAGSNVLSATLYAHSWLGSSSPRASFDGNELGGTQSFDQDGFLEVFRWDVTSLVSGNGDFEVEASGFSRNFGLSLVVVYTHDSLPGSVVLLNDGALSIADDEEAETVSTIFEATAGTGTLWIHTQADDLDQTGEDIRFNGTSIGGPIDANLGNFASLFQFDVDVVEGDNVLEIESPGDWHGCQLAILVAPFDCTPASWTNYGEGWPGTNGIPAFVAEADPTLGTTIDLSLDNSLGENTPAVMMVGIQEAELDTEIGGQILLVPLTLISLVVPGNGLTFPAPIPYGESFCGLSLYIQALQVDAGASSGISFTRGLGLVLGSY